ncbi:MAG: SGNH/GDSL hydrolase family protein [Clostridiales bacterium]|nr:MAG: SGNH/GDSL hydrolase family protein [Clostridiales bacterium]
MKAYIFGDSIMRGVMLDEKENKYCTISENNFNNISDEFSLELNNKSRFGSTLPKGVDLIDKTLEKGLKCDYALVEFGGNDCSYNWNEVSAAPDKDHNPLTPLDTFKNLYIETIKKLRKYNIIPVLMTLPPINAEAYVDWVSRGGNSRENIVLWLGDEFMMYRWHELYSNMISKIAVETKSLCIDVRSNFLERHDFKSLLCRDGIHPNEQGHSIIKDAFKGFLKQEL